MYTQNVLLLRQHLPLLPHTQRKRLLYEAPSPQQRTQHMQEPHQQHQRRHPCLHRHLLRTQLHAAIQTRNPGTATAARTRATSTPSATAGAYNTSTTCAQSARPARGASSIRSSSRTRSRRTGSSCTCTCSRLGRRSSWSSRGRRSRLML
jgi:hypothetical protein